MKLDRTTLAIIYLGLFIGIPLVVAVFSLRVAVLSVLMAIRGVGTLVVGLAGSFAKRPRPKVAGSNHAAESLGVKGQSLPGTPI